MGSGSVPALILTNLATRQDDGFLMHEAFFSLILRLCPPEDNYSEEEYESFSSEQEASDDAVQGQVSSPGRQLKVIGGGSLRNDGSLSGSGGRRV